MLEALSAPATVDWCEANYVVTPWVAEFWNTLSSVPLGIVGLVMAVWTLSRGLPVRFTLGFFGLGVVGWGSAAFHGTLTAWGQALDELPMVWVSLTFLYCLMARDKPRPGWALGLGTYAALFTAGYLSTAQLFAFFIATYAALVTTVVVLSIQVARSGDGRLKALLALAVTAYVGGMASLWLPEQLLGDCGHPFLSVQPHAWFHLTSLVGSAGWLAFAIHDHDVRRADGVRAG